jgi:hypothetical protein
MKVSTAISVRLVALSLLLPLSSSAALGPSSCKDETDALEGCAETSISSGGDVLGSCTDQRASLEECLGAATPDDTSGVSSAGLLSCYAYLAFYDACVAVTNTTGNCPASCIIDGPDQNCDDYDFVYCERQACCTPCNTYMNEYDKCVANAGTCILSNPDCVSGSSMPTLSTYTLVGVALVGAVLTML